MPWMTHLAQGGGQIGADASMRPRLIAVDDLIVKNAYDAYKGASMRPRLIAVDDRRRWADHRAARHASMRPRLIAVDDVLGCGGLVARKASLQ